MAETVSQPLAGTLRVLLMAGGPSMALAMAMAMAPAQSALALQDSPASAAGAADEEAQSLVVVRSSAQALGVGDVLQSGQIVRLAENEEIEILSQRGVSVVYRGPFEGPVSGRGDAVGRSRLKLLRDAIFGLDEGTRVMGGTRQLERPPLTDADNGTDDAPGDPGEEDPAPLGPAGEAILIDLAQGGTWCAVDGVDLWLMRAEYGRARAQLSDGTARAPLTWSYFAEALPWPDAVPRTDGARYSVTFDNGPTLRFDLRVVAPAADPAGTLIVLARSGCRSQVARAAAALEGTPDNGDGPTR